MAAEVGWDDGGRAGTEYHLAKHLAKYADVLWVDPPVSCVTRDRPGAPRIELTPKVVSAQADHAVPHDAAAENDRSTWIEQTGHQVITWPTVRAQIEWALRRVGRRPDVFIACHWHDLLGHWGQGVVNVLYGTDDWVAGANLLDHDPDRLMIEERRAIDRADVVLAVTPQSAERWRGLGADPVVFPNGCDPEAYVDVPTIEPGPVPDGFPTPVAGALGY